MVYIYGGGFVNGAASFDYFGPHYLMENEVIVVTLNYRVGPFGKQIICRVYILEILKIFEQKLNKTLKCAFPL